MPSIWTVDFADIEPRYVRMSGVHRFLSAWFAESPLQHRDPKGYSIKQRTDHADGVQLTLGCVDDGLAKTLADLEPGRQVQFGSTYPRIATISGVECVGAVSWQDLDDYQGTTQWRLEFVSPCAVRTDGVAQPWPDPFPLLRGVAAKWPGGAVAAGLTDAIARSIGVTGVEIRDALYDDAPQPCAGAVGFAEWTWLPHRGRPDADESPAVVERLLRLAEFSGLGAYPQHGMGSVTIAGRRPPSKQQARPRG